MAEAVRYPLYRRRRRSRRRWRLSGLAWRRWIAAAILVVAIGLLALLAVQAPGRDPVQSLAQARSALQERRWTAARDAALAAARGMPGSAPAQMILARAYLALGDGVAAEAALARARAAGVPRSRLYHLRAEARLLQGDDDGALAEAARARSPYVAAARRVRARALAASGKRGAAQAELVALLEETPGDAQAWRELGRIRLTGGEVGAAADAAARAVALDRSDAAALTLQGEVVRKRYGPAAALPWFAEALKRDPADHPALIEQAATLGDLGLYREMLASTRRALAVRPGSPQALYLQAVLAARAGRPVLARSLLDYAGDGVGSTPAALFLGGALDYAGNAPEAAVAQLRQLVGMQPNNIVARRLLGAALLRSGDPAGAVAILRPVGMRADADAYTLEVAARAMAATGNRGDAARLHDRAMRGAQGAATSFPAAADIGTLAADVDEGPTEPTRVLMLIRGLIASHDGAGALAAADRLARASPGAPAAQIAAGDVRLMRGDAAGAALAFGRAADLRFDEPGLLRLVDALGRAGRAGEATRVLATYLAQNPTSTLALRLVGHWQVAAGQWSAAITSLERVRDRVGSRDAALLADLARAYAGAGRGDAALRTARAAYRLMPGKAAVIGAYAAVLHAMGDEDGAAQLEAKAQTMAAG
ncbi:Tetratricopeptide repeat-containing protein [Sphingomonas gellani]|uniref:Tetratricopeptide repeat-containing protein n=1 Tax=Sphingomonas gellani TaxID=1166340 RepID=A0A1H8FZP6_9SPHN|nr:tetratricopeptide repeat protein [Sphingomonas gellani]SEN37119.1 Tetratricopeptide repeat-containing protein [Sphingomonas gellani]